MVARYKVLLRESEEGFAVSCPGLPGCWSQGATEAEALENIRSAIQEYLEAVNDSLKSELSQGSRGRGLALPRLPGVNHLAAVRALEKAGFRVVREGKHVVMSSGTRFVTIPRHNPVNALYHGWNRPRCRPHHRAVSRPPLNASFRSAAASRTERPASLLPVPRHVDDEVHGARGEARDDRHAAGGRAEEAENRVVRARHAEAEVHRFERGRRTRRRDEERAGCRRIRDRDVRGHGHGPDGTPQAPAIGKSRVPFACSAGPPVGPAGPRVSIARQGVIVVNAEAPLPSARDQSVTLSRRS